MPRIVLHVDMDAFFAAIEQRDRPELLGKPVIVGGTPEGRGVVSTASYEARVFGVHSAMPAARAVRLCPHGVFLRVDGRKYRAVSEQVMDLLSRHSDAIEQVSIDEAFLDLTDRAPDYRTAESIARQIKAEIRDELQLTASVGVGPNKFLAKLGSDLRKPDGLVVIRPQEAQAVLAPLSVSKLWGVGPKTAARLQEFGLRTIGDIAGQPITRLRTLLGAWGDALYELSRGIDERPLVTSREMKSVSAERTFPRDLYDDQQLRRVLTDLSKEVARRMQQDGVRGKTITIKVRYGDFRTFTRQTTLAEATDRADVLRHATHALLAEVDRAGQGIRLLGIRATGLEHGPQQLSLFSPQVQRRAELNQTVRYLKDRFGPDAVKWAREMGE